MRRPVVPHLHMSAALAVSLLAHWQPDAKSYERAHNALARADGHALVRMHEGGGMDLYAVQAVPAVGGGASTEWRLQAVLWHDADAALQGFRDLRHWHAERLHGRPSIGCELGTGVEAELWDLSQYEA